MPRPAPALFAVGATAFLFFKDGGDATMRYDHHIMGGTLTNTLAGEYSFTIAVACALLFLGTLAMALETRHRLWIPALFLAATLTSHLVVGVFAFVAARGDLAVLAPAQEHGRAVAIGAVGVALTAVWLVPLAATLKYTTDMRYEPVGTGYTDPWLLGRFGISLPTSFDWLFLSEMWFLFLFALVAIGAGIAYRRRSTLDRGRDHVPRRHRVLRVGAAPRHPRQGAGVEPAPAAVLVPHALSARRARCRRDRALGGTVLRVGACGSARRSRRIDGAATPRVDAKTRAETSSSSCERSPRLLIIGLVAALFTTVALVRINATKGYVTYWAKYNYTGYEGGTAADSTKKDYTEYRAFIDTAAALPPGRMLWEPSSTIGRYGTPLALMMLPYWTDGRISSMEGLYYESSATTPLPLPRRGHAHAHAVERGARAAVPHVGRLQPRCAVPPTARCPLLRGDARHAAAGGEPTRRSARSRPCPTSTSGPPLGWKIYEVADSPVVAPLRYQPVVARDLHADENWKCEGKPKPRARTRPAGRS